MRRTTAIGLTLASALLLTGCGAATAPAPTDGPVAVVASTNVYGQIVSAIGGDDVAVTSLISSAAQDPHSFEPSAQDTLAVSRAELVVQNGGGYDTFMTSLVASTGSTATVLSAVEDEPAWTDAGGQTASPGDPIEGFNEHVWYDVAAMGDFASGIAEELAHLRPADRDAIHGRLLTFVEGIGRLEERLLVLSGQIGGTPIFVTEPVPLYLTAAAGLDNLAPAAFTEAVEEGQDVPAATLLDSLTLIQDRSVRLVIVNAQTEGAETGQVTDAADAAGIPVVRVTETLPDGSTYLDWMAANIQSVKDALSP